MHPMARVLGRSLFFAVLLAFVCPAQASPLLSLILSIAQEVASQPEARPATTVVVLPETYPGTTVEPATLRRLPIMYAPPIPVLMRRIFHTVKSGETLASIAKRYGVAVEDIKRWNSLGRLATGQRLVLEVRAPVRSKPRPKAKPKGKPYKKSSS